MDISEKDLAAHVEQLSGIRHHSRDPSALEAAADYLIGRFRSYGLGVWIHRFEAFGRTNRNIVASLGNTEPDNWRESPPLILAAHYDTVSSSPGADDNASGLAVMLEAARRMAAVGPSRPVAFIAFAQEEEDRLGSRRFVAALRRRGVEIPGMISLECVGYADPVPGSQKRPADLPVDLPETGDFLGLVGNLPAAGLKAAFERAARRYAPDLPIIGFLVPNSGMGFPDTRRSDHASFWDKGYPALMATDTANFRNPHYHRPGDLPNTIHYPFMARVARAAAGLTAGGDF